MIKDSKHETNQAKRHTMELLIGVVLTLLLILILNITIDPTGTWKTNIIKPLVNTSRTAKVKLLKAQTNKPKTLVIGSSRVMKFEPSYLRKFTPAPVFNASVNSAMTEDYFAMANFVINDLKYPIKHIVLGVDVEAFSNRSIDARLISTPELFRQLDASLVTQISTLFKDMTSALSFGRLKLIKKSISYWLKGYPELLSTYQEDGLLSYLKWEKQIKAGTFNKTDLLKKTKAKYERRMNNYTQLNTMRLDRFEQFLNLCKSHQIQVTLFMTPLHPELEQHLVRTIQPYKNLQTKVHQYLVEQAKMFSVVHYKDTRQIKTFQGSEEDYYDGAHPTVLNTRRHIDYLFIHRTNDAL